jgi:hypothetical protein
MFKNLTTSLWTRVTILFFLCFQNYKFIGLISIIKIYAIRMMTRVNFNTNYLVTCGNQGPPIF